jgi:HSP20 family protein
VVELAGMTAGKIDLRLEKGELVLTGTRPTPPMLDETRPRHVHVMEIEHGVFCRSIKLPADVDDEGIEATYRGGYLYITLPRKA